MNITTLAILSDVVHGEPSGNYDGSSLDFASDGVKGIGYYPGQGSLQTVAFRVTDFVGTIKIQATLDYDWKIARWFDVYDYESPTALTDYHTVNLTGNFVWMRARVIDFEQGTIVSVTESY